MLQGKKRKFGKYRIKYLLFSGMYQDRNMDRPRHMAVKGECEKCGERETLNYEYMDRFLFFSKDKPINNGRCIWTVECKNCGNKNLLSQDPRIEPWSTEKTLKMGTGYYNAEIDKDDLLKYDIYDDGDILIE